MKLNVSNIFVDADGLKGYIWPDHVSKEDFLKAVRKYELYNFHSAKAYDEVNVKYRYYKKVRPSTSDVTIFVFVANKVAGYSPCTMLYR